MFIRVFFRLAFVYVFSCFFMAAGEGIASPTGWDIDGKYLDMNEKDLKDRYAKFQNDCPSLACL
jgi:hypothetical protein